MRRSVRAVVVSNGCLLVIKRNKFGQQFYSLPGGGIDDPETAEQALLRELLEETSIVITRPHLVIEADFGETYGHQLLFTGNYLSGTPRLAPDSPEALDTAAGYNTYQPMWLPISDLPSSELLPATVRQLLVQHLAIGWPTASIRLTI